MVKQRVKFTFPTALVKEPIIYRLGRDYNVVTNIRRADVQEEAGWSWSWTATKTRYKKAWTGSAPPESGWTP